MPIFTDDLLQNKAAIQASFSGLFITWEPTKEGGIFASAKTAGPAQFINVSHFVFVKVFDV